jgi:NDP-sugar pyrophosphorylase family protein
LPDQTADYLATVPVLVLAGGLGTRLRPAYEEGPKVMAPVDGHPFLAYVLRRLQAAGFRRIIPCVGYQHESIQRWLGDGQRLGLDVQYSVESEPLGTGGAILQAASRFSHGERFVALNGDSLLQLDFKSMVDAHLDSRAVATIALACGQNTGRYGTVEIDEQDNVRGFREKSGSHAEYFNGGVYLFEPEVLRLVPSGRPVSLEREVLPLLVSQSFKAFRCLGHFIDIGVPEDFLRAQTELKGLVS